MRTVRAFLLFKAAQKSFIMTGLPYLTLLRLDYCSAEMIYCAAPVGILLFFFGVRAKTGIFCLSILHRICTVHLIEYSVQRGEHFSSVIDGNSSEKVLLLLGFWENLVLNSGPEWKQLQTHKWARSMCSGSRLFQGDCRLFSTPKDNFLTFYLVREYLFFPFILFLLLKNKSISVIPALMSVTVEEFCFGLVRRLHRAVTDRRLLVENMEIRQAEGRSSPPGDF